MGVSIHEPQHREEPPKDPKEPENSNGLTNGPNFERIANMQQDVIRESAARVKQLEQELAAKNAPPPDPPVSSEDFFKDPSKHIGKLIDERMKSSVAPLATEISANRIRREYENIKRQVRSDAMGAKVLPLIETQLDAMAEDNISKGMDITPQGVQATIKNLYADLIYNDPSKIVNLNNNNNEPPKNKVIPPNIPSSAGRPGNVAEPPDVERDAMSKLTENEIRLAREFYGTNNNPYSRYLAARDGGDNSSDNQKGSLMILESERGKRK